jgi:hypothetical protein
LGADFVLVLANDSLSVTERLNVQINQNGEFFYCSDGTPLAERKDGYEVPLWHRSRE